jgi:hypothetical protein
MAVALRLEPRVCLARSFQDTHVAVSDWARAYEKNEINEESPPYDLLAAANQRCALSLA